MDPYDLADPIPVLSRLPEDFYSNLSSSKWKDRKELALEPLLATLASSLRYQPDNYTDLVAALAGRMGDANVLCVVLAAQCIEKLARGLRGDFARYKSVVTAPILAKLKEKKQNVQDALGSALDAIAASVSTTRTRPHRVFYTKLTKIEPADFDRRFHRGRDHLCERQEPFRQGLDSLLLHALPLLDEHSPPQGRLARVGRVDEEGPRGFRRRRPCGRGRCARDLAQGCRRARV